MSRTLSILGIAITVVYLGILWFIFDGRLTEILLMSPNEIGDLLAGMFGPLAILWLILGFFQQGIELRQNTRALELQAEELKNAVEQQREMVSVSRKQFEAMTEASQYERARDENAIRPIFFLEISSVRQYQSNPFELLPETVPAGSGPYYIVESSLSNQGNMATELSFVGSNHLAKIYPQKITSIQRREKQELNFLVVVPSEGPYLIDVRYIDAKNALGSQSFKLTPRFSQGGKLEWLEPSKTS